MGPRAGRRAGRTWTAPGSLRGRTRATATGAGDVAGQPLRASSTRFVRSQRSASSIVTPFRAA